MNTNPYPIYIISLKRTPDRRLYIQRQLDALNWQPKVEKKAQKCYIKHPKPSILETKK